MTYNWVDLSSKTLLFVKSMLKLVRTSCKLVCVDQTRCVGVSIHPVLQFPKTLKINGYLSVSVVNQRSSWGSAVFKPGPKQFPTPFTKNLIWLQRRSSPRHLKKLIPKPWFFQDQNERSCCLDLFPFTHWNEQERARQINTMSHIKYYATFLVVIKHVANIRVTSIFTWTILRSKWITSWPFKKLVVSTENPVAITRKWYIFP